MPMLAPEPNVFPVTLFEESVAPFSLEKSWWVLHTKPRQEKALARQLLQANVSFYLPLLPRRNLIRGRLMHSYVPLFTSYVFLLGDGRDRITALATKRVVRCLEVPGQQELWTDLAQVHQLITSGMPVTPEERLFPGTTVEIRRGPLAGLKGTILREAGQNRFVVKVDFIQRGASVILEDYVLAAIEE